MSTTVQQYKQWEHEYMSSLELAAGTHTIQLHKIMECMAEHLTELRSKISDLEDELVSVRQQLPADSYY